MLFNFSKVILFTKIFLIILNMIILFVYAVSTALDKDVLMLWIYYPLM